MTDEELTAMAEYDELLAAWRKTRISRITAWFDKWLGGAGR